MRSLSRNEQLCGETIRQMLTLMNIINQEQMPRFLAEKLRKSLSDFAEQAKTFSYFQRKFSELAKSKTACNLMRVLQGDEFYQSEDSDVNTTENNKILQEIYNFYYKWRKQLYPIRLITTNQQIFTPSHWTYDLIVVITENQQQEKLLLMNPVREGEWNEFKRSFTDKIIAAFKLNIMEGGWTGEHIAVKIYQPKSTKEATCPKDH